MSEYTSYNLVPRVEQPTYTIKPPVWDGNTIQISRYFSASVINHGDSWRAYFHLYASRELPTEAEARAWCEQRYYEWVRQFLSEVK